MSKEKFFVRIDTKIIEMIHELAYKLYHHKHGSIGLVVEESVKSFAKEKLK